MRWSQKTPSSNNAREDSTHVHHQMVNIEIRLIIFFAAKNGEALYSQQKQDELTVTQIMNSLLQNSDLKTVWETTRPFRYDLNQNPYDYTVEMTNRVKGLDLIDRVPWRTMDGGSWHCTRGSDQDCIHGKKEFKKANGCQRYPYK